MARPVQPIGAETYGVNIDTSTEIAGVITVTTAGTPVRGPDVELTNGAIIEGHPSNTGVVYLGNHATDMRSGYGYGLGAGKVTFAQVANLNELYFDAAVSGEKFCWLKKAFPRRRPMGRIESCGFGSRGQP